MTSRSPERVQFLSDVLTTAVEGGINYWSYVSEYKPFGNPPTVYVHEMAEDGEAHEETDAKFFIGINEIARAIRTIQNNPAKFRFAHQGYWLQFWEANRTNGEDGDYDAGIADCIVQVACFGEVVYG